MQITCVPNGLAENHVDEPRNANAHDNEPNGKEYHAVVFLIEHGLPRLVPCVEVMQVHGESSADYLADAGIVILAHAYGTQRLASECGCKCVHWCNALGFAYVMKVTTIVIY